MVRRWVPAADGREWAVRAGVNWSEAHNDVDFEQFEHDVASGPASGIAILLVTLALLLAVILTIPSGVRGSMWLILVVLLAFAALPLQWANSRSWTIVAEAPPYPELGLDAEYWRGTVRGIRAARGEIRRVVRTLRRDPEGLDIGSGRLSRME